MQRKHKETQRVRRARAAIKIQKAWRGSRAIRSARSELLRLRLDKAARKIQASWRVFVLRLNRRAEAQFSEWLENRRRRLFYFTVKSVKRAAVLHRAAATVLQRFARVCLLALRRHRLFLNRKAWRIQRCYRRITHGRRTLWLMLDCRELLCFFRLEAIQRMAVAREESMSRSHIECSCRDPRARLYNTDVFTWTTRRRGDRHRTHVAAENRSSIPHDDRGYYSRVKEFAPPFFVPCAPYRSTSARYKRSMFLPAATFRSSSSRCV